MAGEILVINAGSSSVKISLFDVNAGNPQLLMNGQVEGIGASQRHAYARDAKRQTLFDQTWSAGTGPTDHAEAPGARVGYMSSRRAMSANRVYSGVKTRRATPVGPERCFATMISAMPLSTLSGWYTSSR